MYENLTKKVSAKYLKDNQYLLMTTHYEDDGKLTSQEMCLIDEKSNRCIFCMDVRTLKDLFYDELGYQPYLLFESPKYFKITIPEFRYITKTDLAKAVKKVAREIYTLLFNIKIDNQNINEFLNEKVSKFSMSSGELRYWTQFEKENMK